MPHELILGGQRSGKSRCAEKRAAAWLARPGHSALLLATALALDAEMRARIARHRADRASHVPGLATLEVRASSGPVLLVSNEIGMGVSPMSRAARGFVDGLGWLHPSVAATCSSVTLMVAGIEVPVTRGSA